MKTATVNSSCGTFQIDPDTGEVLAFNQSHPDGYLYNQITRFDVAEYRAFYQGEPAAATSYDILDLGYWYGSGTPSSYEPPDMYWRKEFAVERSTAMSLPLPPSVADALNLTTYKTPSPSE
jgi:hypothetical protein